jgi:hypothetical protein
MNQARYQTIQKHCIAFLEAHLIPINQSYYQQIVSDFVRMIDDQFPNRSGEDLENATRKFLVSWNKSTWPTLGQFIRGLVANMPKLKVAQIEAKPKIDPTVGASKLLQSPLGQQAIEMGIASWLWDWAIKNPDRDPPGDILSQLKHRDEELHKGLSLAAAGEPGPLTMDETPADPARQWAAFSIKQIAHREQQFASGKYF